MKHTLGRNAGLCTILCGLWKILILTQPTYSQVVISQVYGGGGATTGSPSFRNDYIELLNRGTATAELTGYSVQYAPATSATWSATPLSGSIAPGQYYLVQEAGGSLGNVIPSPDAIGTIAMSAANGKVALVGSTTVLSGLCPVNPPVVDLVGYGSASCFEGLGAVAPLSTTLAALRLDDGCTDTDNNSADFVTGTPAPRNTSSPLYPCTSVPIQLAYFTGQANPVTRTIDLRWGTVSEVNNYGFNLQKRAESEATFKAIPGSFVTGHGTTLIPQDYSYSDSMSAAGNWLYRLVQIDFDGTAHLSNPIAISAITAVQSGPNLRKLLILQCYPNPFNPSTTIEFSLAVQGCVSLKVFNILGREIAVLVDKELPAGNYTAEWNADRFAGGVYICRLQSGGTIHTTRLVLLK